MKFSTLFILILSIGWTSYGFGQSSPSTIKSFLQSQKQRLHLIDEDISDYKITDNYTTQHNGVRHIYINQQYHGIPVYNAITSIHVDKKGNYHMTASRFVSDLKSRIVGTSAQLPAIEAVRAAVKALGIPGAIVPQQVVSREENGGIRIEKTNFSNTPIVVKPVYTPAEDGKVYLSWDLAIDRKDNDDYMSIRVNALTGEVVNMNNWTVYCDANRIRTLQNRNHTGNTPKAKETICRPAPAAKGAYRVIPLPGESPLHMPFALLQSPSDPQASPLGWHDNNSKQFTITRGNNVHAYLDEFNADAPSSPEPDGGADLIFDFPYDSSSSSQSIQNQKAAVTNLFYMNNMMHDITYSFGFDEKAGNFQDYNFGKGGTGGDHVNAQAQDGSGRNNANFSTPSDGLSGRMQMFLWDGANGGVFNVVQDDGTTWAVDIVPAGFGAKIPTPPIEGRAQEADDGSINPSRACEEPLNDMKGKVAIIDRGTCEFGFKSLNAQKAGAIAVLICGFDNSRVNMGGGEVGDQVSIPVFYAPRNECVKIRALTEGSFKIRIGREEVQDSVINDGDFDNGVIAHEYGHGISNRLTGGPSASGCLSNGEQMGEGWSDFFALVLTHRPGDKGTDTRGIGNFVTSQPIDGVGIRTKPYSTDLEVNDFTYFSARTLSIPHGLGSVWCTMLWEMYWAFIDEYGFDPDLSNKNSGNAQAIQLVMDGMKLQPCRPGFVDGRDAILLADSLNNGGVNSCLIWKAFAKRGLGYGADQGSSTSIGDAEEKESFEVPPLCQNRLRIWKSMTDIVKAGEEITVTIKIANNKRDSSLNVVVKDIIPDQTTYKMGSANITPDINGNTLTWTFDKLKSLEQKEITYTLVSNKDNKSVLHWAERIKDDLEVFDKDWKDISVKGGNAWDVTDEYQHEGPWAFYIYSDPAENDQHLFMRNGVKLNQANPALRFYHWYSMTKDGSKPAVGTVELSVNDGPFTLAKDLFIKNGFTGPIPYGVFVEPFYEGFYGKSNGFVQSYVDLSAFKGQNIKVKFRFGNEDLSGTLPQEEPYGWVIDDIELIDLISYNAEACISAEGIDESCVTADGKGTLVEVGASVASKDVKKGNTAIGIYPNPAGKIAVLKFHTGQSAKGDLQVMQSGKTLFTKRDIDLKGPFLLDVHGWSAGMYIVKLTTKDSKIFTRKLVVAH